MEVYNRKTKQFGEIELSGDEITYHPVYKVHGPDGKLIDTWPVDMDGKRYYLTKPSPESPEYAPTTVSGSLSDSGDAGIAERTTAFLRRDDSVVADGTDGLSSDGDTVG